MGVAPFPFGMSPTGVLVHTPVIGGNLRIVGPGSRQLAQRMLLAWEDDAEYAFLGAADPTFFDDSSLYEPHTVASDAISSAGLLRGLLAEVESRRPETEHDSAVIVVVEHVDALLASAAAPPGADGSLRELERQSALFIRQALRHLVVHGPSVGMSVLATYTAEPNEDWPNTATIRLDFPTTLQRGNQVLPFTPV